MNEIKIKDLLDKISSKMSKEDVFLVYELEKLLFNKVLPSYLKDLNNVEIDIRYQKDFIAYLDIDKNIKDSSIEKYIDALSKIKEIIEYTYDISIPFSLSTVKDSIWFKALIADFESNQRNVNLNLKWHHILSAAYNNYYRFLKSKQTTFKKVILNSKTTFFCDVDNKKVCRKPSVSNMKQVGSDNSLYFGIKDESIMYELLKSITGLNDKNFNQKFKMTSYGLNIEVETNLNKQSQIQVKINGDGQMYKLFNMYQIKMMSTVNMNDVYICVNFNTMEVTFISERDMNV